MSEKHISNIALLHVTEEAKHKTVETIIAESTPVPTYFLLLVLSSVIITIGLFLANESVVIGGMVVSPLLSPITSLAMGIVLTDRKLIYRSLYVLLKSVLLVFAISILISFIVPVNINEVIVSRTNASLMFFYVAIASGVAAGFSYVKKYVQEHIVGVAVAIAILPPISVAGIGVRTLSVEIFSGAIQLFIINLLGIIGSIMVVFSLFGFYSARRKAEETLDVETKKLEEYKKESEEESNKIKEEVGV